MEYAVLLESGQVYNLHSTVLKEFLLVLCRQHRLKGKKKKMCPEKEQWHLRITRKVSSRISLFMYTAKRCGIEPRARCGTAGTGHLK